MKIYQSFFFELLIISFLGVMAGWVINMLLKLLRCFIEELGFKGFLMDMRTFNFGCMGFLSVYLTSHWNEKTKSRGVQLDNNFTIVIIIFFEFVSFPIIICNFATDTNPKTQPMAQEKSFNMSTTKDYFAFIGYKREDEKWAEWLQHKLEHYRLPVNVRKENAALPQTIRPIFKDTSELAAGVLAEEIRNALENSKFLIVICSPRAAQSEWVGKEVQTFIDMGRSDKIIPFIIGGTPFSKDSEEECFPSALLKLPKEQELLGVNINEMGRDAAVVKVVDAHVRSEVRYSVAEI